VAATAPRRSTTSDVNGVVDFEPECDDPALCFPG